MRIFYKIRILGYCLFCSRFRVSLVIKLNGQ